MNAHFVELTSSLHDKYMAYFPHLYHAIAFSLAKVTIEFQKENTENIFSMIRSEFLLTISLATSSPGTWLPIFQSNKSYLLKAMEAYLKEFRKIQQALQKDNLEMLFQYIEEINNIKNMYKPKFLGLEK